MIIVGAGLAGLITAHAFPRSAIFEAAPEPRMAHRALLRFRSDAVARLTGIEFRRVQVRKGIYRDGQFREPTIGEANRYTMKCLGAFIGERSIWDLAPVTRYVAPPDFHEQLVMSVRSRVTYDTPIDLAAQVRQDRPVISTVPMDLTLSALGVDAPATFQRAGITVMRGNLPASDVFQTIYFTNPDIPLYRASITGDVVIAEFTDTPETSCGQWEVELMEAFHLLRVPDWEERVHQRYGKIAPIDDGLRKSLVAKLTVDHGLYSVGRFATWRNILLDDVVQDVDVVKRLIKSSEYDRRIKSL